MSLPNNSLSTVPVTANFLSPDELARPSRLIDYERGGVAFGDASEGITVRNWIATCDGTSVKCSPYPEGTPETTFYTGSGITEISFTWDQNMNPTLAMIEGGTPRLYWYDSSIPGYTTTDYPGATSLVVTLDDKRLRTQAASDVLLFYIKSGNLYFRLQRERYGTERLLKSAPLRASRLVKAGMNNLNRVQLQLQ
jgi:hypothetical protein